MARLELAASWSQTRRPTNWATPGYEIEGILPKWSNMWSKAILDQSRGEVKYKRTTRCISIGYYTRKNWKKQSKLLPDAVANDPGVVYDSREVISLEKKGISQETLKLIACITMLLDHIGAVFVRGYTLRIIGRIAFPIYCFLLAEGAVHTKNPRKYAFRLFIGMLLSEIPFDLALKGGLTWSNQSVMVTLLLGFLAIELLKAAKWDWLKLLIVGAFCGLAEWANTDYGGFGVLLIVLFSQTRGKLWLQALMLILVAWMMNSVRIPVFGYRIPIELFAVLSMIPIACYSGRKATSCKAVQVGFYLFYPVHLTGIFLAEVVYTSMQTGVSFWQVFTSCFLR